jgi:hypothetical protein
MNCSFGSEESPGSTGGLGSFILPLLACNRDGREETSDISELQLILNRAGVYLVQLYVNDEEVQVAVKIRV